MFVHSFFAFFTAESQIFRVEVVCDTNVRGKSRLFGSFSSHFDKSSSPETTTGGNALKFYSSIRLDIRRIQAIKDGETNIGNRVRVKIVKNKVAPPFKQAEFDIMYGEGISKAGDILDCAVEAKIIEKAGSWYSYEGNRIGQGRENVKKWLEENPATLDIIEGKLLDTLKVEEPEEEAPFNVDEDGVVIE